MRSLVFQLSQHDAVLPALIREIRESSQLETFGKPVYPKSRKNAFCRVLSMLPGRRHELELSEKSRREWSSGLVVETDGYFHCEVELLEALLSIDAWYTEEVRKLKALLKKERTKRYVPELEAA